MYNTIQAEDLGSNCSNPIPLGYFKYMSKPSIGQITFTAHNLSRNTAGKWELTITWVQPNKGLDPLLNSAPEYIGIPFPEGKVCRDTHHGVKFERTYSSIGLRDGAEYAALVSWRGGEENPFILSVCDIEEFNKVRNQKKAPNQPILKVPNGTFRVHCLGNTVTGDLEKIMHDLTMEWADDPTEALTSPDAQWEQKDGMRYYSMALPPVLPQVNTLVLSLAKAKSTTA